MRKRKTISQRCPVCASPARRSRVLVTIKTAMEKTRASRSTVGRWMGLGYVEWVRLPRGSPRIYLDSLFKNSPPERRFSARRRIAGRRRGN